MAIYFQGVSDSILEATFQLEALFPLYTNGIHPTNIHLNRRYVIIIILRIELLISFIQSTFLCIGSAWIGFTASTGSTGQNQDILNWSFSFCKYQISNLSAR